MIVCRSVRPCANGLGVAVDLRGLLDIQFPLDVLDRLSD